MFNFKKLVSVFVCLTLLLFIFTSCNQGLQGLQGEDGITPVIEISSDGYWIINNEKTNIKAIGVDGTNGIGITNIEVVQGNLIITYSNGTIIDLGSILPQTEGTEGLDYYPLPDGTYGVSMGKTQYLEEIVIPATYNGKAVTQINNKAFSHSTNLKNIVIPDSVKSIGNSAFESCSSLTNLIIPDSVKSIGTHAFNGCTSLSEITIPNKTEQLGDGIFRNCTSLLKCTILCDITSINYAMFENCTSLTTVNIPNSVECIENSAFRNCRSLESIVIPIKTTNIINQAFYDCYNLTIVYYCGTLSNWNSISIGSSNTKLTSATRYYYTSTSPTSAGNYWRYVNGEPTAW